MKTKDVLVIGGGAAGMAAAYAAAMSGSKVTLIEKNEKLGKKVYITGKGRCNVTNACPEEEFIQHVVTNPRFLYGAFHRFSNEDVMSLLERAGCPLKTERGNRVFPVSDHASDVIRAFSGLLSELGVQMLFHHELLSVETEDGRVSGAFVKLPSGGRSFFPASAVVLATGGRSYPATGSTGDGYRVLSSLGHEIVRPYPSLVPLETQEEWPKALSGLTLKNVRFTVFHGKQEAYSEFGELLFTHFGVSGPIVLSASSFVTALLNEGETLSAEIDLKPALDLETLDRRLQTELSANGKKQIGNVMTALLPSSLVPAFIRIAGFEGTETAASVTREERKRLVKTLKALPLTLSSTRGFEEAIVTKGGVSVKEVRPSTMESKLVSGLFIAGELLDVDALTGGFNLQAAWSTGYAAGTGASEYAMRTGAIE